MNTNKKLMTRINNEFLIGHFRVQPSRNKIYFSDQEIKITPLLMSILTMLAEHHGETVTKEQLFDEVWGDVAVSEAALFRNISELRKVFGDDAKLQNFIETIPKKGYRLKADVIFLDSKIQRLIRSSQSAKLISFSLLVLVVLAATLSIRSFYFDKKIEYLAPKIDYLTSNKANQRRPRISSSGRYLLYFNNDNGRRSMILSDQKSGADTTLLNNSQGILTATFSPNEQEVIYAINTNEVCELHQISLITKIDDQLFECPPNSMPLIAVDWSADGNYLLYGTKGKKSDKLSFSIKNITTLKTLDLTASEVYSIRYPRFSNDSKKVVYVATPYSAGLTHEIGIFDLDSKKSEIIYSSNDFIFQVNWDGNNEDIYFLVGPGKNNAKGLWKINSRTNVVTHMLNGDFIDMDFNSRNGQFVFAQLASQRNIWAYQRDKGEGTTEKKHLRLTDSNLIDREPTLSPDGKTLAFVSNRSGNNEIWLKSLDDKTVKQLTRFNNSSLSVPIWLPSGSKISFNITIDRKKTFFIFDIIRNSFQQIDLPVNAGAIDWVSDDILYWSSPSSTDNKVLLRKTNIVTSETTDITSMRTSFFRYHPEFGIIYSPYSDSKKLFVYSLEQNRHQELGGISLNSPTSWDFFGDQLFYLKRDIQNIQNAPNFSINSFDLVTLKNKFISSVKIPRIQDFGRTMLSVGENSVYYTRLENVAIDLVSVTFDCKLSSNCEAISSN